MRARHVAECIGHGLTIAGITVDLCPVADGGEGTLDVLLGAIGGDTFWTTVTAPLGRRVIGRYAILADERTAVVEVAEASGLDRVADHERDAFAATTRGTGELIVAAASRGVDVVLVAAGGSATTDGGAGALGAIADAGGLGGTKIVVLCDVSTTFESAAARFGPQKGADRETVGRLELRLHEMARKMRRDPRGQPMTGAAGGLAGGLWANLGATLRAGAAAVLEAVNFDRRLSAASAAIVGEGRLDPTTLDGKILWEIAVRARRANVPCHAVVGTVALDKEQLDPLGLKSLVEAGNPARLMAVGQRLGEQLAAGHPGAAPLHIQARQQKPDGANASCG
jgi:glycerate kinase